RAYPRLSLRRRFPPLADAGPVSIYAVRTILSIIKLANVRLKHHLGSAPNSAANSAAGPVLAPRIPLPAASPNCRQQSDLSMIITLKGRFSGRSEAFLPASREMVRPSRGADR